MPSHDGSVLNSSFYGGTGIAGLSGFGDKRRGDAVDSLLQFSRNRGRAHPTDQLLSHGNSTMQMP